MVSERIYLDTRGVSLGTVRQAHALKEWLRILRPDLDVQLRYAEQFSNTRFGISDRDIFRKIQENPVLGALYNNKFLHKFARPLNRFNSSMKGYIQNVEKQIKEIPDAKYVIFHDTLALALSESDMLKRISNCVVVNDASPRLNHFKLNGVGRWVLPVFVPEVRDNLSKKARDSKFKASYGFITDPLFSQAESQRVRVDGSPINVTFAFSGGGLYYKSLTVALNSFLPFMKNPAEKIRLTVACSTNQSYNVATSFFNSHNVNVVSHDGYFQNPRFVNLIPREQSEDLETLMAGDSKFLQAQYSAISKSDALVIANPTELLLPFMGVPEYYGSKKRGDHEASNALYAVQEEKHAKRLESLANAGSQIYNDARNKDGYLSELKKNSMVRTNNSEKVALEILNHFGL